MTTLQEKTIENKLQQLEVSKRPHLSNYLELFRELLLYEGNCKVKYLERAYEIKRKVIKTFYEGE